MTEACARVQELAPELALGLLSGEERARVLDHLVTCEACRSTAEQLAAAADALLLAAPEVEPPAGFESRTLARLGPSRPARRRRGRAAVLAAAVVVAGIVGMAIGSLLRPLGGHDHAEPVRSVHLAVTSGHGSGEVYTYAGDPPWLFVTVRGVADGTYTCRIRVRGDQALEIGHLGVRDGQGAWGRALSVDPGRIAAVELVDAAGRVVAASRA